MAVKRAPGGAGDKVDAVTPEQTRPIKRTKAQTSLSKAADGCGSALNSVLVFGDKFGLYKTGQYSFGMEEPSAETKEWPRDPISCPAFGFPPDSA